MADESVSQLTDRLAKLIDQPRLRNLFERDQKSWLQLWSSLHVIEDCQLALEAYLASGVEKANREDGPRRDLGMLFLKTYGALQTLVVQQDALRDMSESLGYSLRRDDHPELQAIRDIRIRGVGHPTKRERGKKEMPSFHGIVQMSLTDTGFQLHSNSEEGLNVEQVDIPELIASQRGSAVRILRDTITKLEQGSTADGTD